VRRQQGCSAVSLTIEMEASQSGTESERQRRLKRITRQREHDESSGSAGGKRLTLRKTNSGGKSMDRA